MIAKAPSRRRVGTGRPVTAYRVNTYDNCAEGWEKAPKVRQDALRTGTMRPADMSVYDYLCSRMNADCDVWVSEARISRETGLSDRTVSDCLDRLYAIGAVERIGWRETASGWKCRIRRVSDLAITLSLQRTPAGVSPLDSVRDADMALDTSLSSSARNSAHAINLRGTEAAEYKLRYAMDRARLRAAERGLDPDEYEEGWYTRHPNAPRCNQAPGWARTIWERGYQHKNGRDVSGDQAEHGFTPRVSHVDETEESYGSMADLVMSGSDYEIHGVLGCDIDAENDTW
jgi:predicted DNA-binding transcriptional regulator